MRGGVVFQSTGKNEHAVNENLLLNLAKSSELRWRKERELSGIIAINERKESPFSASDPTRATLPERLSS